MLKIKDNVDLKVLEKYGIYPRYEMINKTTGETTLDGYQTFEAKFSGLFFKKKKTKLITRIIGFKDKKFCLVLNADKFGVPDMDLLYDLIKDGLVEKVEDK